MPDLIAGRYIVEREVGRGSAGIVYRARDTRDGRIVAIKVLREEFASAVTSKRFAQEIALLARMHHPNLLPVYDSGEWDGTPFYVSPFLDGETLRARIERDRQLPLDDVLTITREAGDALRYAHDQGVVHRDVKPENLLLGDGHVVVADFGIAYALERAGGDRLTSSQLVLGTPAYMSPEQAAAEQQLDGRSDQYSLACVVYEMLAGVTPFTGATREAVIGQRFTHRPMGLRAHRPDLPEHIDRAVARALSVAPADRFRSIADFVDALTNPQATATSPLARHRTLILAAAAVVILVLAAAARAIVGSGGAPPPDLRHIGVTSFAARGGGPGVTDVAAGLTEQLVVELSGVNALTVVALTDSSACVPRGVACDSLVHNRRLGALIHGSVDRIGDKYQASIQIVDAATGAAAHSERFTTTDTSRSGAEQDLAVSIAQSVRRWLGREARFAALENGTSVGRARDLMLIAERAREDGVAISDQPAPEDLPTAFAAFGRADSLTGLARRADPRWLEPLFARGWVAYDVSRIQAGTARMASLQRGLAVADSALAMDTSSARALELRGTLRWGVLTELDPTTDTTQVGVAERDLRGAVARDSTRALAWQSLSYLLSVRGAFAEAELAGRRALDQDAFLDGARTTTYEAFYNATMVPDLVAAAHWCDYGRRTRPGDWMFLQCQLVLMRRDRSARPDADSAWRLVAEMNRLDPPEKARAAGRAYFAIFRRMVAATISVRAGHPDVALAEIARAHHATNGSEELAIDLLYDESLLRQELGEHATARRLAYQLLCARPLEQHLILRDPLFAWLPPPPPCPASGVPAGTPRTPPT